MAQNADPPVLFSKHLFRTGVVCPTKLYYKSHNYPQNQQAIPFIRHAVYNKRLLKSLARAAYPKGKYIAGSSVRESSAQTGKELQQEQVVLFNAVFEHQRMMARLPIVEKKGQTVQVFHIQTKAFDSRNQHLLDNRDRIIAKWRTYLLDFAYQLYVLKQSIPSVKIRPFLILPDKSGHSQTENLPVLLTERMQKKGAVEIPSSNQQILVKLEVKEHIKRIWNDPHFAQQFLPKDSFEESLIYLRQLYVNKEKVTPPVGMRCKNCEFRIEQDRALQGVKSGFSECWLPHTAADNSTGRHIFDLIGPGTEEWIHQEIYDQCQIPDEDFAALKSLTHSHGSISQKMRQALQIHKAKGRNVPEEIIRPALIKELRRWKYPLHFLDFEAGNYAIPARQGRRPYHLVVFQYSCHTLHKDGRWHHHQWIDDLSSGYPNYELIRRLKKIPYINEGTIVQYSNFERNALKIIRRELMDEQETVPDASELTQWIENIIQRHDSSHHQPPYVADLSRQVKHYYYNGEMTNSLSIKDVLHSVMAQSEFLKQEYSQPYNSQNFKNMIWWQKDGKDKVQNPYQLLNEDGEGVRRGSEAMVVYGKLISEDLTKEEKNHYQKVLLKYCELDTLAMLMIYQHWAQAISED